MSIASCPLEASPTTSRSGSASSRDLKPARTMPWSSQTTMRGHSVSFNGRVADSRVPPPGAGSSRTVPPYRATRSRMPTRPCPPSAAPVATPRPSSVDLDVEPGRAPAQGDRRVAGAAVAQGVGETLLGDPVRRQVEAGAQLDGVSLDGERGGACRPCSPARRAGRARRGPAAGASEADSPSVRSTPKSRRISASASRAVASTAARSAASRAWSGPRRRRTAWVWMVTTLIEWDTMSCSSRAIRVRSSWAIARGLAARARPRAGRRARRPPRPASARSRVSDADGPRAGEEDQSRPRGR